MDKFFLPKDKKKFINWLLKISNLNNWTIVLEYQDVKVFNELKENATIVNLPKTAQHNHNHECKLTAIKGPVVTESFTDILLTEVSSLSVHNEKEILFLIADDFHEDCFSSSLKFFDMYGNILEDLDLIYKN